MKTIWSWLRDERVGHLEILKVPVVLHLELSQLLRTGKANWELLQSAHGIVATLVKGWLRLEESQNTLLALEVVLAEYEVGELLDANVGLCSLHGEQLAALWARRCELLDPFWLWTWCHCERVYVCKGKGGKGGYQMESWRESRKGSGNNRGYMGDI